MTDHRHPVWVLLDKIQMDNAAQAAKIVELRAHVSSLHLDQTVQTTGQWQPALGHHDPIEVVKRLIRNQVITTQIDLTAEMDGHPSLTGSDRAVLEALLGDNA